MEKRGDVVIFKESIETIQRIHGDDFAGVERKERERKKERRRGERGEKDFYYEYLYLKTDREGEGEGDKGTDIVEQGATYYRQ